MPRRVFFSFDFDDVWRVNQIRNIGAISEEDRPCTPNEIEKVRRQSDDAIMRWIREQMEGRSCVAVLIGTNTFKSKWVLYEILYGWSQEKGVFGIYIHNLKDQYGNTAPPGPSPFLAFELEVPNVFPDLPPMRLPFNQIVKAYDPGSVDPRNVISGNLERWIEEAIRIRQEWKNSRLVPKRQTR